ncbi:MAG: alpha/beta hydrolase [Rhodospirillales bacterium]|nr:alpha/beta hydrolase [Rhodospirillales bacterium]
MPTSSRSAFTLGAGLSFLTAAGALLAAGAFSPLGLLNAVAPKDGYVRNENLAYGPLPRQKLDVYVPVEAKRPFRVVVFFHGGGWKSGSKDLYRFVGQALAKRGFVAVVADYGLYPDVQFPEFLSDSAAVVRWTRNNIADYGGDLDHLFLMGHSAGAYNAAMISVNPAYLANEGLTPEVISGVVGLAGPYGFNPLLYSSTRPIFEGAADAEATRPVSFVSADAPPMLLLHGLDDGTVKPLNSRRMAKRLTQAGAKATLIEYGGIGHYIILVALAAPFQGEDGIMDAAAAFIRGESVPIPAGARRNTTFSAEGEAPAS